MSEMRILAVLVLTALAGPLLADPPRKPGPTPEMLSRYLLGEAQKHFDARRQVVAALKTPAEVVARQKTLRKHFLDAIGPFPEKTPLNARVVGKKKCDGYTLERVVYESRPSHHVTANFYLPAGPGPFPGVLLPCGHSDNGKAAEPYQRACISMAKHGLAVLCYDPIGQGERVQILDAQGKPALKSSTAEHTLAGTGALLVGQSAAGYRIWDGIRSLDYLAGRPEVDPKRLGCTGNSGGGTMTAYLMALDDRIVAAAPSCYITSLERLFATIGPQDAEQNITGQVAFGMEHADYVTMRAPRPTLVLTATRDFFDITGSWTSFREAKLLYGLLGHGERVDLFEYDSKHGFNKPRREASMRWMRRWLLNKDDAPAEGDFPIHTDAELQCTRTGQVLEDFKGVSVFGLNQKQSVLAAKKRAKFLADAGTDGLQKEVRRLLALPERILPATLYTGSEGVEKPVILEPEPGIYLAGYQRQPPGGADVRKPIVLLLDARGASHLYDRESSAARFLKDGSTVYAVDLRGFGASAPKKGGETEAFLAFHIGRPLLGQRVRDILSLVAFFGRNSDFAGVHLVARGATGPAALHAALLDPRIKAVTLENSLISWQSVVDIPLSKGQLGNVVPGVLAYYDLPDLAARMAPRPLTIRNPVDAAGRPVSQKELERVHAECRKTYNKAQGKLTLEAAK
jgi:dienelactone hydrolase